MCRPLVCREDIIILLYTCRSIRMFLLNTPLNQRGIMTADVYSLLTITHLSHTLEEATAVSPGHSVFHVASYRRSVIRSFSTCRNARVDSCRGQVLTCLGKEGTSSCGKRWRRMRRRTRSSRIAHPWIQHRMETIVSAQIRYDISPARRDHNNNVMPSARQIQLPHVISSDRCHCACRHNQLIIPDVSTQLAR